MKKESGSALITVILVVLVLTMVGIAGMLFMTIEDLISQNDLLQKEAFYAAESGMRIGEDIVFRRGRNDLTIELCNHYDGSTITYSSIAPPNPVPPSLGWPTPGNKDNYGSGPMLLGTYMINTTDLGDVEMKNIPVPMASGTTGRYAFYTLFLRNNHEDPGGGAVADSDGKINILSYGWVQDNPDPLAANRHILYEKIVEEGMNLGSSGGSRSPNNPGNTGQIS
jgi:hypothetical protein